MSSEIPRPDPDAKKDLLKATLYTLGPVFAALIVGSSTGNWSAAVAIMLGGYAYAAWRVRTKSLGDGSK